MQRSEKGFEKTWTLDYNESNSMITKHHCCNCSRKWTFQPLLGPWPCHHRLPSVTHLQQITSLTSSFVQLILDAHQLNILRGCVKTASDVKNHASRHFIGGPTAATDEVTTTPLLPAWTLLRFMPASCTLLWQCASIFQRPARNILKLHIYACINV